jgi:hypothetical protein
MFVCVFAFVCVVGLRDCTFVCLCVCVFVAVALAVACGLWLVVVACGLWLDRGTCGFEAKVYF